MNSYVLVVGTLLFLFTWSDPALGTNSLGGKPGSSVQKGSAGLGGPKTYVARYVNVGPPGGQKPAQGPTSGGSPSRSRAGSTFGSNGKVAHQQWSNSGSTSNRRIQALDLASPSSTKIKPGSNVWQSSPFTSTRTGVDLTNNRNGATSSGRGFTTGEEQPLRPQYVQKYFEKGKWVERLDKTLAGYEKRDESVGAVGINAFYGTRAYTDGNIFGRVQDLLRGTNSGNRVETPESRAQLQNIVSDTNQAIRTLRSKDVQKTYRGFRSTDFLNRGPLRAGDTFTFTDKAFASSSLDKGVATRFASAKNPEGPSAVKKEGQSAVMKIYSNQAADIQSLSKMPHEKERLFPSGTTFHVFKTKEGKDGGPMRMSARAIPDRRQSAEV